MGWYRCPLGKLVELNCGTRINSRHNDVSFVVWLIRDDERVSIMVRVR